MSTATPAPDARQAPVLRSNLVALGTITRREVMRILRIWSQTLVPPAITMTLYFLIFGGLIGSRIGDMGGYSYMEFIVPGLVMMSVIQNSYGNISSSFFGAKLGRHVEELLVSPMPNWVNLLGYVLCAVLRGGRSGIGDDDRGRLARMAIARRCHRRPHIHRRQLPLVHRSCRDDRMAQFPLRGSRR